MKLNLISGLTIRMVPQGNKIQSLISLAGHQVTSNLRIGNLRICFYTKTFVTTENEQIGQMYLGREELKIRRTGGTRCGTIENEADVTSQLLDTDKKKISVTRFMIQEQ